jgi:hypothetical protein
MRLGISKPEAVHDTPKEVWNWRLFWSAAVFGTILTPSASNDVYHTKKDKDCSA